MGHRGGGPPFENAKHMNDRQDDLPRHIKRAKPISKRPWKVEHSYVGGMSGLSWLDGRWMSVGRYETRERAEQAVEQMSRSWSIWKYRITEVK